LYYFFLGCREPLLDSTRAQTKESKTKWEDPSGKMPGKRNRTILTNEQFFFVTTTILEFKHVFTNDERCQILINNIKHYQKVFDFIILAYVIMPSHFHWIVKVNPAKGTISDVMRDIKKYSAWDLLEQLEKEKSVLLETFILNKSGKQKRQLWMHRFDDEVIRNNKMFWVKLKYIHDNPVKAGLVSVPEKYKYSSARNYINNDHSVINIDTNWGGVEII